MEELQTNTDVKTLRQINEVLYQAILSILMSHHHNEGTLDFKHKEFDNLNQTLDYVGVRYFDISPESDREEEEYEEWIKDGKIVLSDIEAYHELTARLHIMSNCFIF